MSTTARTTRSVERWSSSSTVPAARVLHTETTDSAGYYNFNDYTLTAGTTYNLVTPDYATTGVGIQTTINPATDNTSLPGYAHAIKVTVENLSAQQNITLDWTGRFRG